MTSRRLAFITALAIGLFAATAWAQTPPAPGAKPAGEPKTGSLTLDQVEQSEFTQEVEQIQKQKSVIRRQTIDKLESLLRDHPYYENKADVYFRLAESYWEEEKYAYLVAMKEYDDKSEAFEEGLIKEKPEPAVENYATSLENYRRILREFPEYMRLDEVLYYLGKGAMMQGKATKDRQMMKEGENTLKRLVQSYPNSILIPQAYLALAEYYFEGNSLFYAKINYEKIINNYKMSAMYNYALYKLAWVYYNLRELQKAIDTFKAVVSEVSVAGEAGRIQFRSQALNDMVVVYAEMEEDDAWQNAREYFLSVVSEEETYKKIIRMADLIQAADKHEVAIAMYRHFIERKPNEQRVPEFYDRVYTSLRDINDYVAIEAFINEIFKYFDPEGTWMTVNKEHGEAAATAQKLDQDGLLWISNDQHRKAEKARKNEDKKRNYADAAKYYRMFAYRYPDADKAYLVNFYYAEILYDQLLDFEEAAKQYQAVIEKDKKGKYVEDAALGVIYCTEKLLIKAGLLEEGPKKGGIVLKRQKQVKDFEEEIEVTPLSPQEKQYIDAADQYVNIMTDFINDPELKKKYPKKGEKIPEIMFIAAQTFYRHGMFLDAVKRLQTIFAYNPKHKYASYSVFTLLDCYIRLHRWEQVEQWTRKLIAEKNFTVKKKPELQKIVAISMTEQTKDLMLERKYPQAEKKMKAILREFGRDKKLASKTTFNLAAVYERSHQLKKAVATYETVIKKFPDSSSAPLAMFVIGELYESQTMYEKAARRFEKMERFKKDENAPTALSNAGAIWEALERFDDAIKAYRKYIKLFSKKVDNIPTVELHIGKLYEAKKTPKDDKKAIAEYEKYARKHKKGVRVVEAWSRSGMLLYKADKKRNKNKILKVFKSAMDTFAKLEAKEITAAAKFFAAQAAFISTEYVFDEFEAVKIMATSTWKLKKVLTQKAELHQKLEKTYQSILDYKSLHWNAACLFRIGLIYYNFARSLLDAPIPDGLTLDQEDEYRFALEQISGPIEEKSLKAFEYALRLAHEKQTYNEWSRKSAEFAATVNPDLFPLKEEKLVTTDKVKDSLLSTSVVRTLRRGTTTVKVLEVEGEKKKRKRKELDFGVDRDDKKDGKKGAEKKGGK